MYLCVLAVLINLFAMSGLDFVNTPFDYAFVWWAVIHVQYFF